MAIYLTEDRDLEAVADAIRNKGGTSADLEFPHGYIDAIDAISVGLVGLNYHVDDVTRTSTSNAINVDRQFTNFILLAFLKDPPTTKPSSNYALAQLFVYTGGRYWAPSHATFAVKQQGTSGVNITAVSVNPSGLSVSATTIGVTLYSAIYSVTGVWRIIQIELPSSLGTYNFRDVQDTLNGAT